MIPHLFRHHPVPDTIPERLMSQVDKFSAETESDEEFIKKCFFLVVDRQAGMRGGLVTRFSRLFWNDLEHLCDFRGYLHCTTVNYLLRILLLKSGRIPSERVRQKLTTTWFIFPHQYLRIKISDTEYLNVDVWSYRFGIDFGDFAHGFHSGSFVPQR